MKTAIAICACMALTACAGGKSAASPPLNKWIMRALEKGMTEQQVAAIGGGRVPDTVAETTCGKDTPKPFDCKVYVYDWALRAGQYDPKVTVIFEKDRGQWLVSQWL